MAKDRGHVYTGPGFQVLPICDNVIPISHLDLILYGVESPWPYHSKYRTSPAVSTLSGSILEGNVRMGDSHVYGHFGLDSNLISI